MRKSICEVPDYHYTFWLEEQIIKSAAESRLTSGCNLTPPPEDRDCCIHNRGDTCFIENVIRKCGDKPCIVNFANSIKQ
jgi:hypothetical protein